MTFHGQFCVPASSFKKPFINEDGEYIIILFAQHYNKILFHRIFFIVTSVYVSILHKLFLDETNLRIVCGSWFQTKDHCAQVKMHTYM